MAQSLSNKNVQMAHVVNLISIATMDGQFVDSEKQLLFQIARDLGISSEEFDQCIDIAARAQGKVIYEVPESDDQKVSFLKNVALMMMIDGVIDEKEREYLSILADRFGFNGDEAVDILIKTIVDEVKQGMKNNGTGALSDTQTDEEEMSEEEYQK